MVVTRSLARQNMSVTQNGVQRDVNNVEGAGLQFQDGETDQRLQSDADGSGANSLADNMATSMQATMLKMMKTMMLSMTAMQQTITQSMNVRGPPTQSSSPGTEEASAVTYCVMPDLSASIQDFNGDQGRARAWLDSLLRTANNHRWPDVLRCFHLTGVCR